MPKSNTHRGFQSALLGGGCLLRVFTSSVPQLLWGYTNDRIQLVHVPCVCLRH